MISWTGLYNEYCSFLRYQRKMGDVKDGGKLKTKWGWNLDGGSGG